MRYTHLRRADLNLLPALQALIDERSVSRAAERLHLSQPAMSRVLDRLQEMFGDELLIRRGRGFEPTHRALQVRDELDRLLPRLDGLLRGGEFDPATSAETYRVAAPDFAALLFLPPLIEQIAARAPASRIEIQNYGDDALEMLAANRTDLTFGVNHAPSPFAFEPLYEEEMACLVRAGHELCSGPVTVERYLGQRHLAQVRGDAAESIDRTLAEHGGARDVQVRMPYLVPAVWAVERSDLVLTLPRMLAQRFAQATGTVVLPAPVELHRFTYILVWHRRAERDPAHVWLREQMLEAVARRVAEMTGDDPSAACGASRVAPNA